MIVHVTWHAHSRCGHASVCALAGMWRRSTRTPFAQLPRCPYSWHTILHPSTEAQQLYMARAGPRANSHRHLALALAVAAVRLGITVTSLYLAARKEGRGTRRRLASAASALRLQARGRRLSHMHLWLPHAAAADGAESCLGRTAASCRRAARALIVVRAAGSWGPALAPRGALACAARPAPWPRGCGRLVGASPASRCA